MLCYVMLRKNSACLKTMGSHELTLHTAPTCGTQIHPVLPKQRDKSVFFVQIMEKRFQVELLRKRMF